ncbi:MAG: ABC transporter ATP-binding protein [Clostridia bacterium]|nr:ABC transporter ATP-binding protein [Clostridia bacterium]
MKIENLSKRFGKKVVFDDYTTEILDNKINYLVGPSGSGKTTLLRILSGLDKDFNGSIDSNLQKISIVFQEPRLFPNLTIEENIRIVSESEDSIDEILKIVELENDAKLLPKELSGGMKMRVALARALFYDGDIFIMDEPFSALDDELKERMIPKIFKLLKNKTILIVSHDLNEVKKYGEHIIEIN